MTEFSNDTQRRIASGELTDPMWAPAGSLGRLTCRFQDVLDARSEEELEAIRQEAGPNDTPRAETVLRSRRHRLKSNMES